MNIYEMTVDVPNKFVYTHMYTQYKKVCHQIGRFAKRNFSDGDRQEEFNTQMVHALKQNDEVGFESTTKDGDPAKVIIKRFKATNRKMV